VVAVSEQPQQRERERERERERNNLQETLKAQPPERRKGDPLLGFSGRRALRREQCCMYTHC
jgi:hypothetical protein